MSSKLDALRQALAVSPDNPPLLLLYAQGCLDEWLLDDARTGFEKILALNPAHGEAQVGVARACCISRGKRARPPCAWNRS